MENSKYGNHIVTNLKTPPRFSPEFNAIYAGWATRILYMDKDVVPGAFQMNCSWYRQPAPPNTAESKSHTHDADEIIGFFGSDYREPYKLGAEIEFWLEDEKYLITSSAMIFVPRGMRHCPLILKRVDEPVFHFSVVTTGVYNYIPAQQ